MKMSGRRLILFDCDGTLVDSLGHIHRTLAGAFSLWGAPEPSREAVRELIGLPLNKLICRLVPDADEDGVVAIAGAYRDAFLESGGAEGVLFDGAADLLARLADGACVLGVATGKGRDGLSRVLAYHGIDGHFSILKTADDGPGKPAPDIVLDAMQETGFSNAETFVIGDTTFDMEMAYNAGVTAIGVGWGYHAAERLTEAGAAAVAESFDEIPALLEALRHPGPMRGRGD